MLNAFRTEVVNSRGRAPRASRFFQLFLSCAAHSLYTEWRESTPHTQTLLPNTRLARPACFTMATFSGFCQGRGLHFCRRQSPHTCISPPQYVRGASQPHTSHLTAPKLRAPPALSSGRAVRHPAARRALSTHHMPPPPPPPPPPRRLSLRVWCARPRVRARAAHGSVPAPTLHVRTVVGI